MTRRRVIRTVFLLTVEERELVERLAEQSGETISSLVRQLIRREAADKLGWAPSVPKAKAKTTTRKAAR